MSDKYTSLPILESFLNLLKITFGHKKTTIKISKALNENILDINYVETDLDFNTDYIVETDSTSNVLGFAVLGELTLE